MQFEVYCYASYTMPTSQKYFYLSIGYVLTLIKHQMVFSLCRILFFDFYTSWSICHYSEYLRLDVIARFEFPSNGVFLEARIVGFSMKSTLISVCHWIKIHRDINVLIVRTSIVWRYSNIPSCKRVSHHNFSDLYLMLFGFILFYLNYDKLLISCFDYETSKTNKK